MQRATKVRRRRGLTAAAAAVAAAATVGLAVPALAAQDKQATTASAPVLGPGQVGSRAAVPWARVGPGWSLVLYSAAQGGEGVPAKAGPSTLYLVTPAGGRYRLVTWAASSSQTHWILQAWSGDMSRAMFIPQDDAYNVSRREHIYQLQLRTGAVTSFRLPLGMAALGYTRPDGLNILAATTIVNGPSGYGSLKRFSLTGHLVKTLARVRGLGQAVYQPAGAQIAAGSRDGIALVSNGGGVIRNLPVPGATQDCNAVRWWSASTILASCWVQNGPRLWLVPASGASPTALTPVRTGTGFDMGDFNAWQLSSGLYVNGVSACDTLVIGRQPAHGAEQQIRVPGATSAFVVNATRTRLLVERVNDCSPGVSLVWFNPATRAMTVALGVSQNQHGVVGVVPYYMAGKY